MTVHFMPWNGSKWRKYAKKISCKFSMIFITSDFQQFVSVCRVLMCLAFYLKCSFNVHHFRIGMSFLCTDSTSFVTDQATHFFISMWRAYSFINNQVTIEERHYTQCFVEICHFSDIGSELSPALTDSRRSDWLTDCWNMQHQQQPQLHQQL